MPRITSLAICALLLAASSTLLGGCGQPDPRPNIVLIVMDTLRADRLGSDGYERPLTPAMDAFAEQAVVYGNAYATAPWTLPSHASLFTGLLATQHGARTYKNAQGEIALAPLPAENVTLAEILKDEGYKTGAFIANDGFMTPRYQLDQGFDVYEVNPVRARELNRDIARWVDRAGKGPFFLFVNYMDTHRVYNTEPRPGLLPQPAVQDQGQLLDRLIDAVMPADGSPVPEHLVQQVVDQYDTSVANLDEQVGRLLAHLERRGLAENTIVILTSDHGEYLGEHDLVEHSKDVYEEAVRVPLLIRWPGEDTAVGRVDECTSLAALPVMLLTRLPGDEALARLHPQAHRPGQTPVVTENFYTRRRDFNDPRWGHRFDRERAAIYDWPYKLISSSTDAPELYKLDTDPGELDDLAAAEPERVQQLLGRLESLREAQANPAAAPSDSPLSEREKRRLRSLGY